MKSSVQLWKRMIQIGPILVVVVIGLIREFSRLGLWHIQGFRWELLLMYALFIIGGILGYFLVDLDEFLKKRRITNPQVGEILLQWKRSVRNVLTCAVIALCGIWVISSSGSALAWGLVFAMQLRLFSELLFAEDYAGWYWVISRQISRVENRIFLIVWGAVIFGQWLGLVKS